MFVIIHHNARTTLNATFEIFLQIFLVKVQKGAFRLVPLRTKYQIMQNLKCFTVKNTYVVKIKFRWFGLTFLSAQYVINHTLQLRILKYFDKSVTRNQQPARNIVK